MPIGDSGQGYGLVDDVFDAVRAFRKQYTDAQLHPDRDELPPARRKKPPKKGKSETIASSS